MSTLDVDANWPYALVQTHDSSANQAALAMTTATRKFDGPGIGWSTLTAKEGRVAEAVSEGLTNRQVAKLLFMSHYTVDAHLRHIYWKLGINSRTQLTRLHLERAYGLQATA